jgi:hypothetical protein
VGDVCLDLFVPHDMDVGRGYDERQLEKPETILERLVNFVSCSTDSEFLKQDGCLHSL